MKKTSCVVIVGKPGAGKSSIGAMLAELLEGKYMSLGGFMRDTLNIPDPHIGVDKNSVYGKLYKHLVDRESLETLVLDCHPYPEDDLAALQAFIGKPSLKLWAVVHVIADDAVALKRLERRPRPGQAFADRIAYYNDHMHLIESLMVSSISRVISNNTDFEDDMGIKALAMSILGDLQKIRSGVP